MQLALMPSKNIVVAIYNKYIKKVKKAEYYD